jgi:hypothetical protein
MSHTSENSHCAPLIEACTLNLFEKNIFRITGLPVDASTKEVSRQAQKLQMLEEMGGATPNQAAFPLNPPPSTEQIREALARMKEPELRLVDEFFWFWPETFGDSKTDPAINALQSGDGQKAVDIWVERENNGSVTATHNLAVMFHMYAVDWTNHHLGNQEEHSRVEKQDSPWAPPQKRVAILDSGRDVKIKGYWKDAFDRWEQLADADDLWDVVKNRVRSLEDEALTIGFVRRMRALLPQAFDRINAEAALKFAEHGRMDWAQFHVDFMRETHAGLDDVNSTAEMVLAPTKRRVEQRLNSAHNEVDRHPEKGTQVALDLMSHCRPLMALFDLFHGADSHQRSDLFDEVAKTVANVVISYQKATGDNKAFVEILQQALDFASGSQIRERLIKNIAIGEGNLAANMLEPFFKSLESITEGAGTLSAKLEQLKAKILTQLPTLAAKLGSTSHAYRQLMDSVAIALRGLSIDAHNDHKDFQTAGEAIELAAKLAVDADLKLRIQNDASVLAENKKQSLCYFCGTQTAKADSVLQLAMYGEVNRYYGGVQYRKGTVPIPRCGDCKGKQESASSTGCVIWVICLIIGIGVGMAYDEKSGWLMGAFLGGGVGWILSVIVAEAMKSSSGLKNPKDHSEVRKMILQGWSIGDGPSR